jgi:hypothetical protein
VQAFTQLYNKDSKQPKTKLMVKASDEESHAPEKGSKKI